MQTGGIDDIILHIFIQLPLSKNKKICVFESEILHILSADGIIITAKWFQKMKNI